MKDFVMKRERTGSSHLETVSDYPIRVDLWETGDIKRYEINANEEWVLTATVEVRFWANRAQLPDASKAAEKVMLSRLYGSILSHVHELRLALIGGDRHAALAVCDRIEDEILKV